MRPARLRGNQFGMSDKAECVGGFVTGNNFQKTRFLEELTDGELLDGGQDGALCAKRRLAQLFQVHLCQRKRIPVDACT